MCSVLKLPQVPQLPEKPPKSAEIPVHHVVLTAASQQGSGLVRWVLAEEARTSTDTCLHVAVSGDTVCYHNWGRGGGGATDI